MIRNLSFLLILLSQLLASIDSSAQYNQRRMEIDQERGALGYFDKEALEKSRQFIKKDSSYYVGHLFEGSYKYYRAADKQGFQQALKPLERAYRQMVRDYNSKLKLRTSDIFRYMDVYRYHFDFGALCYMMTECYENIDQAEKAVALCHTFSKYKIQKSSFNPHTRLSWIYHRNRIYNKEKYPFLKENLAENEEASMKFLDTAVGIYYRDLPLNATFFGYDQLYQELLSIYHYKSILHSYNYHIDSAEYYYSKLLQQSPSYAPYNNYGHLKIVRGDFEKAIENFDKAALQPIHGKTTLEYHYMLSMLNVYNGKSEESIKKLKSIIKSQGSSPGFGWHNIALARNYYYMGMTEKSIKTAEKAENFEEMYIGTTWVPEQYKSATGVLQFMNKTAEIQRIKFENKGWWYSISDLFRLSKLYIERFLMRFNLANVFSQSHEREEVTYRIFSSEGLITFDEIWELIRDFSPKYFSKKFKELKEEDKRENLQRYYTYFLAKIQLEDENYEEASKGFEEVLSDEKIDEENEKLLIARCYEALAMIAEEEDKEEEVIKYKLLFYDIYPQLMPFSDLSLKMNLKLPTGNLTPQQQQIIESLKDSDIDWTEKEDSRYPTAVISFSKREKNDEVNFSVSKDGVEFQQGSFIVEDTEDAGKLTAFGLFGVKRFDWEL